MQVSIMQIRSEDVRVGDVERHVSGQGRLMPWRRVAAVETGRGSGLFVTLVYEGHDVMGGSVRRLDLVEVQREEQ